MRQEKIRSDAVKSGILLDEPQITLLGRSSGQQFPLYFALLAMGLAGMFGWFYTAFPIPISIWPVICSGAAFSALFSWIFLLDRRRSLWTAILLTAGLVLLLLFIEPLEQGFFLTYNYVVQVYSDLSGLLFIRFPLASVNDGQTVLYCTAFAIALLFGVSLLLAWMLIRKKSLLGCLLVSLPFVISSLVYTIIPAYEAIVCLVAFLTFLLLNRSTLGWGGIAVREGKKLYRIGNGKGQPRSLLLLPVLLCCLSAISLAFPQEEYQRAFWADRLRSALLGQGSLSYITDNSGAGGFTDRIDLESMGDLQFTGETILRVQTSKREVDYLKGFVGSVYTGQSWEGLTSRDYSRLDALLNGYRTQNFPDWFIDLLRCQADQDSYMYQLSVINVGGDPRSVYTPYGLSSKPSELDGLQFVNDGVLRASNPIFGVEEYRFQARSLAWNQQFLSLRQRMSDSLAAIPPQNGTTLEAMGLYADSVQFGEYSDYDDSWTAPEELLNALAERQRAFVGASQDYTEFVYEHYTQLPDSLRSSLAVYLESRGLSGPETANPWQLAQRVGELLQSENGYSLTPGLTPEGKDFIEYFLFENHRGYCVHFASAAVALLRTMGVPARYVGGFVIPYDGVSDYQGWMNIADSQAHAWVELYLSGIGWIPVEVTPGRENGEAADQIPSYEPPVSWEEPQPEENEESSEPESSSTLSSSEESLPDSQESSSQTESSTGGELPGGSSDVEQARPLPGLLWAAVWLALAATAAAMALLLRRKQLEAQKRRFLQKNHNAGVLEIYSYLLRLYRFRQRRLGCSDQLPQQLYQLVLKARFSQHMLTLEERRLLLDYAVRLADQTRQQLSPVWRFVGRYVCLLF